MSLTDNVMKLGNILLRQKVINEEQLALLENEKNKKERQRKKYGNKGIAGQEPNNAIKIIEKLKLNAGKNRKLDETVIMRAVAKEYNLEFRKLDPLELDADVVTDTIPMPFAMKHLTVPLYEANGSLTIALTDPEEKDALDKIKMVSGMKIDLVISTRTDIEKIINQFFSFSKTMQQAEDDVTGLSVDLGNLEQLAHIRSEAEVSSTDKHIQNAVDSLFRDALNIRSSDIHIEPKRGETIVRNRIDGMLIDTYRFPKAVHSAIVSRIKLLARMDISEKRRPQDGRIKISHNEKEVEMRVSVLPVAFGEKVVVRIFDYEMAYRDLDSLGFPARELSRYKTLLKKPYGVVLVTGPTGSGKTSTLYSSLKFLSSAEKNIVTIEDPIEMVVPEFNQLGVQPSIELTFAHALRAILRQDPDIIMIGEIRDPETAENAVQAALTGHMVISTLHTNDTVSSLTRLYDLGIDPFLMKTALNGILSQRLIRVVCNDCKKPANYPEEALTAVGIKSDSGLKFFKGTGCEKCRKTGYYGRTGIHELLEMTDNIRALIDGKTEEETIRAKAIKAGMTTLQQNAAKLLIKGETTLEELLRLTHA